MGSYTRTVNDIDNETGINKLSMERQSSTVLDIKSYRPCNYLKNEHFKQIIIVKFNPRMNYLKQIIIV